MMNLQKLLRFPEHGYIYIYGMICSCMWAGLCFRGDVVKKNVSFMDGMNIAKGSKFQRQTR